MLHYLYSVETAVYLNKRKGKSLKIESGFSIMMTNNAVNPAKF